VPVDLSIEIMDNTTHPDTENELPPALKVAITLRHLATGEIPRFSSPKNADLASPIN